MPVHVPGPRLFSSIPFKHLAASAKGGAHGRAANVALNLTPFVDMMTILVTFLLMVFSASGSITVPKGMELPSATNKDLLQQAPVILVTRESITFNGEHMAEVESIINDTSPQWKVVELFERMKQEIQLFSLNFEKQPQSERDRCEEGYEQKPGKMCLRGLAILQADKTTEAKVINRLLKTANAAGYANVMFAVNRRGS